MLFDIRIAVVLKKANEYSMKMLFLFLIFFTVAALVNGQAYCTFEGCDCSAGNSCTISNATYFFDREEFVYGGSLVMEIGPTAELTIMEFVVPGGKITIPDGAFVILGGINVTAKSVVNEYILVDAIEVTGPTWSPLYATPSDTCTSPQIFFSQGGKYANATIKTCCLAGCDTTTTTAMTTTTTSPLMSNSTTKEPDTASLGTPLWIILSFIIASVLILL